MSVDAKVTIFTNKMRTEFVTAYTATAEPAPWEDFTWVFPSGARIEHYNFMSPTPGLAKYAGHRRYGKIDVVYYRVENKEFDAAFEVLLRDVEDDTTSGYEIKPKELSQRAKLFPGRWVLKQLALGKTLNCYDGGAFIADSHAIGTVDNLIAYTSTGSSDSATYKLIALHRGGPLKPLIWQSRKGPRFMTNAGESRSFEAKILRYWIDLEGECAFGYPWDVCWVDITNTPDVNDMHKIFAAVEKQFRTYQLPKSLASEDGEYIHEQTVFSSGNMTFAGSTGLSEVLRQALNEDWAPQTIGSNTVATTNRFKGYAKYVVSAFLN